MREKRIAGLGRRGSPDHGERGERERGGTRVKAVHRGLHKKNSSPKPLPGKRRNADYCKFLLAIELKV